MYAAAEALIPVLERLEQNRPIIWAAAQEHKIEPEFLAAVLMEEIRNRPNVYHLGDLIASPFKDISGGVGQVRISNVRHDIKEINGVPVSQLNRFTIAVALLNDKFGIEAAAAHLREIARQYRRYAQRAVDPDELPAKSAFDPNDPAAWTDSDRILMSMKYTGGAFPDGRVG